ncbi:Aste57867_21625 [Aphanomyces stellatus]|uniref:Aste57867_21625 protein n=1 Tax=Aphanomyces stellatus TaxID=120398 RepID=A0A485LI09_9STRA|nr:hypothetical protein As57867_021556 [Aphanomyces stellatus]VFT98295.1 Aste57867_21625 [Aphanomyces stellatus]
MLLLQLQDGPMPLMLDDTADVLTMLLRRQVEHRPACDYLITTQRGGGIDATMRRRIAAWMVDVATEFRFTVDETVDLALNYLDRYLSQVTTTKHELQLVGLAALLVASKFLETDALLMAEAAEMAKVAGFTPARIQAAELALLRALDWNLHVVLPVHFVDLFVADLHIPTLHNTTRALLAANRLSYTLLAFPPSHVATAVVALACHLTGHPASAFATYLVDKALPAADHTCQRHLLHGYDTAAGRSASSPPPIKRDRSPSPVGVDDDLFESITFDMTPPPTTHAVVPQVKRAKPNVAAVAE